MSDKKELEEEIEQLREEMESMVREKGGFLDHKVYKLSKELDKKILVCMNKEKNK